MMLDSLDRAFLDHWSVARTGGSAMPPPTPAVSGSVAWLAPAVLPGTSAETSTAAAAPSSASSAPAPDEDSGLVGRLLEVARADLCAVADEIEAARRRGRRVIAITACERGAGCSTLVAGLLRVLTSRGIDARSGNGDGPPHDGPTHDRRILLVDAGVWFPPGRIQRRRLLLASVGCDAAILVRREDRPAPSGWSVALEAIGVEPLGEVVSFAAPSPAAAPVPGGTR